MDSNLLQSMMLRVIILLLELQNSILGELTNKFLRFQHYGLSESTGINQTATCEAENECIDRCIKDLLCTAISMNYGVPGKCKPGKLNKYGRVQLIQAGNWTTWIRGIYRSQFLESFMSLGRENPII